MLSRRRKSILPPPKREAKEVELDDNRERPPRVKGPAIITKESSRLQSASSRGIGSTEVLIPLHLYNIDAISIAPSEKAIFERRSVHEKRRKKVREGERKLERERERERKGNRDCYLCSRKVQVMDR